jgi:hypothetical protein
VAWSASAKSWMASCQWRQSRSYCASARTTIGVISWTWTRQVRQLVGCPEEETDRGCDRWSRSQGWSCPGGHAGARAQHTPG